MLRNAKIYEQIREALTQRVQASELSAQDVLDDLLAVGCSDIGRYVDIDPRGNILINLSAVQEGDLRAVQEISQAEATDKGTRTGKRTRIKLYNKVDALGKLLTYLEQAGLLYPKET